MLTLVPIEWVEDGYLGKKSMRGYDINYHCALVDRRRAARTLRKVMKTKPRKHKGGRNKRVIPSKMPKRYRELFR